MDHLVASPRAAHPSFHVVHNLRSTYWGGRDLNGRHTIVLPGVTPTTATESASKNKPETLCSLFDPGLSIRMVSFIGSRSMGLL